MTLYRQLCLAVSATALIAMAGNGPAFGQTILFEENFDGLLPTLGDSINERVGTDFVTEEASDPDSSPIPGVWSATSPGWTVDKNLSTYDGSPTVTPGVPGQGLTEYGVDEWEGWGFTRLDFWSEKDDQDRGLFGTATNASGTAAVADPDEYFDLGSQNDAVNGGYYSTGLTSPSFAVIEGVFYGLGFDSSWRDESFDDSALGDTIVDQNNQSVEIIVNYNNGSQQLIKWNSDSTDAFFKNDAPDENIPADGSPGTLLFEAPTGATSATISFNLANGANDWWWAVDNIEVNDLINGGPAVLFEDFEDTPLGDSVNERIGASTKVTSAPGSSTTVLGTVYPTEAFPEAFTHAAPADWTVDTTIDAENVGDNNQGIFEWENWSFATPEFWTFTGESGREGFTKGTGVIAIADGDAWTDGGEGIIDETGSLLTLLKTPAIDLTGLDPTDRILIEFDSSWRAEDEQTAKLTALLDGTPVELLSWDINTPDGLDESIRLMLDPQGASSLQLNFEYFGGNDWWWAIDNVRVSSAPIPEPSSIMLVAAAVAAGLGLRRR